MKIYILPVEEALRPIVLRTPYPPHNVRHRNVERDFHQYLLSRPELLVDSPDKADWCYLPVYWFYYWMSFCKKWGAWWKSLPELQVVLDCYWDLLYKTFIISQQGLGPKVEFLGKTTLFLASRMGRNGYDIPLLSEHFVSIPVEFKPYLASYVGRVVPEETFRMEMVEQLKERDDILLRYSKERKHKAKNYQRDYIRSILQSYIVLCPRGFAGGSSYRFFEAMQLGVVPLLIGDIDNRPFSNFLKWNEVSLYLPNVNGLSDKLSEWGNDKERLLEMGRKAREFYYEHLDYGKWCCFVIMQLEALNANKQGNSVSV